MELVNMSFVTGIFSSILKTSKVIPIFKKGPPFEASNYQPISLLSNIEKIYDKWMYNRHVSFLNTQPNLIQAIRLLKISLYCSYSNQYC